MFECPHKMCERVKEETTEIMKNSAKVHILTRQNLGQKLLSRPLTVHRLPEIKFLWKMWAADMCHNLDFGEREEIFPSPKVFCLRLSLKVQDLYIFLQFWDASVIYFFSPF